MSAVFRVGAVLLSVLHLVSIFLPHRPDYLMALSALAVLLPGLFLMGKGFRKATFVFLAAGLGILIGTRQSAAVWASSFNSMTNTVAIMVVLQLFTVPVAAGGYDQAIKSWVAWRLKGPGVLFVFSILVTHVLTSFLMLGAIPVSISLLGPAIEARIPDHRRFLAAVVTRGYVLAALWAPGTINLYLVVQATGVAWSAILLPGFILAALGLGFSILMESGSGGVIGRSAGASEPGAGGGPAADAAAGAPAGQGRAIAHILVVAAGIVLCVLGLEALKIGLGYTRIMLSGCLVSLLWTAAVWRNPRAKAAGALRSGFEVYWTEGIMKVRDMGPFFVAMGIFSTAVEASGWLDAVKPALQAAASGLGVGAVFLLPLAVILLSLAGLHPFITIAMFGKILSRAGLAVPPLSVALALAAGGAAAYMISPFAGIIMSVARYTGAKASEVAIRWNWKFSLGFYCLGIAFSLAWGTLFGR